MNGTFAIGGLRGANEAGVLFVAMIRRRAVLGLAALQALVFWPMVDLAGAVTVAGGTSHTLVVRNDRSRARQVLQSLDCLRRP